MKNRYVAALCVPFLITMVSAQEGSERAGERLSQDLARGVDSRSGLEQLAGRTVKLFGQESETGRSVLRALASLGAEVEDLRALGELRRSLEVARGNLEFKPVLEAPLPEGWPLTTPVDRIEVREYPAYRAAWVDSSGERPLPENRMFMTLFRHIQREKIAMTAPVEMGYGEGEQMKPSSMAFLYRHTGQGKPGAEGAVEVVDVSAAMAISLGMRGVLSEARLADARARLQKWLESQGGRFEKAGEIRVLGYNSPFVPWFRRYHEVQLPVRAVERADG